MNWDNASERAALIEQVGHKEYERRLAAHHARSIVATVNGYDIWPVTCRFGRLFHVGGTQKAFRTLEEAKTFAAQRNSHVAQPFRDILNDFAATKHG